MLQSGSYPDITNASTFIANPAAGTVIADTGQVPAGNYAIYMIASSDANSRIRIEHRDISNSTNVNGTPIIVLLGTQAPIEIFLKQSTNTNERYRVVMDSALAGNIAATLNIFRIT